MDLGKELKQKWNIIEWKNKGKEIHIHFNNNELGNLALKVKNLKRNRANIYLSFKPKKIPITQYYFLYCFLINWKNYIDKNGINWVKLNLDLDREIEKFGNEVIKFLKKIDNRLVKEFKKQKEDFFYTVYNSIKNNSSLIPNSNDNNLIIIAIHINEWKVFMGNFSIEEEKEKEIFQDLRKLFKKAKPEKGKEKEKTKYVIEILNEILQYKYKI